MYTNIETSNTSFTDPALIEKLGAKCIEKFIAYELPLAMAQERYGGHFQVAMQVCTKPTIFAFSISMVSGHFVSFGSKSLAYP